MGVVDKFGHGPKKAIEMEPSENVLVSTGAIQVLEFLVGSAIYTVIEYPRELQKFGVSYVDLYPKPKQATYQKL